MTPAELTVLTSDGAVTVSAQAEDDRFLLEATAVQTVTGWEPKPEGLCRGDVCVPLRDPAVRDTFGRYDLARVAAALQRPFAAEQTDSDVVVISIGDAAHERAAAYRVGSAPHVELVDLDGRPVTVPAHSRRKRLLLAWSSW